MTTICKKLQLVSVGAFFCLAGGLWAGQAETARDFLAARGGDAAAVFWAAREDTLQTGATPTHLWVARGLFRPAADKNPRSETALLEAAKMQARHRLVRELLARAEGEIKWRDREVAAKAYLQAGEENPAFRIAGIETFTGTENGGHWAVVAVRPEAEIAKMRANFARREFVPYYCRMAYAVAEKEFAAGDFVAAERRLEEIHACGYDNAAAYLLWARALAKTGSADAARRVGVEILERFAAQLTAAMAETLGDLFMELQCEPEACRAYELAMTRLE